jgi:hypothetical protein
MTLPHNFDDSKVNNQLELNDVSRIMESNPQKQFQPFEIHRDHSISKLTRNPCKHSKYTHAVVVVVILSWALSSYQPSFKKSMVSIQLSP